MCIAGVCTSCTYDIVLYGFLVAFIVSHTKLAITQTLEARTYLKLLTFAGFLRETETVK